MEATLIRSNVNKSHKGTRVLLESQTYKHGIT